MFRAHYPVGKDEVVKKEILLAVISREVFEQLYNHLGKPLADARYDEIDKALMKCSVRKRTFRWNKKNSKGWTVKGSTATLTVSRSWQKLRVDRSGFAWEGPVGRGVDSQIIRENLRFTA